MYEGIIKEKVFINRVVAFATKDFVLEYSPIFTEEDNVNLQRHITKENKDSLFMKISYYPVIHDCFDRDIYIHSNISDIDAIFVYFDEYRIEDIERNAINIINEMYYAYNFRSSKEKRLAVGFYVDYHHRCNSDNAIIYTEDNMFVIDAFDISDGIPGIEKKAPMRVYSFNDYQRKPWSDKAVFTYDFTNDWPEVVTAREPDTIVSEDD